MHNLAQLHVRDGGVIREADAQQAVEDGYMGYHPSSATVHALAQRLGGNHPVTHVEVLGHVYTPVQLALVAL
ncbi:hypothetical protein GCM10023084_54240 [Streptomyces lacrimifluminis]|uniref:Uncharacterized protein n=1 Tax=Streptomyces lacrimifluminis TaxID=1500077 RepID=A0A917KWX7_9ACTN|nr:hypothetical protein GCM10012282_33620 [Streptomyces lacrimifluminis]